MSLEILANAFHEVTTLTKSQANALARKTVETIEYELAHNGEFQFRGLGRLELIKNNYKNNTPSNSFARKPAPVRARFVPSDGMKERILKAHDVLVPAQKANDGQQPLI